MCAPRASEDESENEPTSTPCLITSTPDTIGGQLRAGRFRPAQFVRRVRPNFPAPSERMASRAIAVHVKDHNIAL